MLVAMSRAVFLAMVVVVVDGRPRAFATRASRLRAVAPRVSVGGGGRRDLPSHPRDASRDAVMVVVIVVVDFAANDAVLTERTNAASIGRAPAVVVVVVAFGEQSMVFVLEVPLVHVEVRPLAHGDEQRGEREDGEEEDRQRLLGRLWRARGDHAGLRSSRGRGCERRRVRDANGSRGSTL